MKRQYFIIIGVIIILLSLAACSPRLNLFGSIREPLKEYTLEGRGAEKILLIPINGMISDTPKKEFVSSSPSIVEQVVTQLKKAEKNGNIRAVILKIDSPGGSITASDIIYHEILLFKERTKAKIVVSMTDLAMSGAYYISLPADIIMAHPTTMTGSVGVIFMRPRVKNLMDKIGFGVDVKKTGKFKDIGSPFRESTEEEEMLIQKTVDIFGVRFLKLVQKHRNPEKPALDKIATAQIFTADEALKVRLVDKIGYLSDAVKEAKLIANLPADAPVVMYRHEKTPDINYYKRAASGSPALNVSAVNIDFPEINFKSGFYYLWPESIIYKE